MRSFHVYILTGSLLMVIVMSTEMSDHNPSRVRRQENVYGSRCETPNGRIGVCVLAQTCPDVLLFRFNPFFAGSYLRQDICSAGPEGFLVCCSTYPMSYYSYVPFPPSPTFSPVPQQQSSPQSSLNSRLPSECGRAFISRIVGGQRSEVGRWPWMAALGIRQRNGNFLLICGGTLITKRHVLSAAHCFHPINDVRQVRMGAVDLDSKSNGTVPIDINVDKVIMHKDYNNNTMQNDIAIVTLATPVAYTNFIRPICLPLDMAQVDLSRRSTTVLGWGATAFGGPVTSTLQQVDVTIMATRECQRRYAGVSGAVITSNMLCAGRNGKDACTGDSGGPMLVLNSNARYTEVGIVSFGVQCANNKYPGVYTRVASYLNWIANNLK